MKRGYQTGKAARQHFEHTIAALFSVPKSTAKKAAKRVPEKSTQPGAGCPTLIRSLIADRVGSAPEAQR